MGKGEAGCVSLNSVFALRDSPDYFHTATGLNNDLDVGAGRPPVHFTLSPLAALSPPPSELSKE